MKPVMHLPSRTAPRARAARTSTQRLRPTTAPYNRADLP